jgi:hypothetical protein
MAASATAGAEAGRLLKLADLPFLKLPGAKVTCMSGVADSSDTVAATMDGL